VQRTRTWKHRLFEAAGLTIIVLTTLALPIARAQDSDRAKARALVDAAIKMTNSEQAVKLLWQATEIAPADNEAYVYLGLYYNSRQDFAKVAEVYKKLLKYSPKEASAYLNVGEAYMSFSPPKYDDALVYYRKAYELDPHSSFAALRIGEILAQEGRVAEAAKYLRQAAADTANNPTAASEAQKVLKQIGAS
jgi:protein O-GlcNAc transferase